MSFFLFFDCLSPNVLFIINVDSQLLHLKFSFISRTRLCECKSVNVLEFRVYSNEHGHNVVSMHIFRLLFIFKEILDMCKRRTDHQHQREHFVMPIALIIYLAFPLKTD